MVIQSAQELGIPSTITLYHKRWTFHAYYGYSDDAKGVVERISGIYIKDNVRWRKIAIIRTFKHWPLGKKGANDKWFNTYYCVYSREEPA